MCGSSIVASNHWKSISHKGTKTRSNRDDQLRGLMNLLLRDFVSSCEPHPSLTRRVTFLLRPERFALDEGVNELADGELFGVR